MKPKLKIVKYTPHKGRNILGDYIDEPPVYSICKETGFIFREKTYLRYRQPWCANSPTWDEIKKWRHQYMYILLMI